VSIAYFGQSDKDPVKRVYVKNKKTKKP